MTFSCQVCNTETIINIEFDCQKFVCPHCNCMHTKSNNNFSPNKNTKPFVYETLFSIGQKGFFENEEYCVVSMSVKQTYIGYFWREYVLATNDSKFLYLSEFQGHFVLLREIEFDGSVLKNPLYAEYENQSYRLYEYSNPKVLEARGFFDFDYTRPYKLNEYLNGINMLSFEQIGSEQTAYFGTHISHDEIKKAFEIETLPSKNGVGLVQPFLINLKNLALIFCTTAILILITILILDNNREEKEVLNTKLEYSTTNNKIFQSPSFTLVGSAAPLTIDLYSNVNNSWASVSVGLVNEKTNEEVYATKNIEYYQGYEDGESWSEGQKSESFNICGVSAGTYHFIVSPSKAAEDVTENNLEIKAKWSKPSLWNFVMICIFMALIILIIYFCKYNFEYKRWKDSDYSIYNTEQ